MENPHQDNDSLIIVKPGIENKRLGWGLIVPFGGRDFLHDGLKNFFYANPFLCTGKNRILTIDTDNILDLLLDPLWLCAGEVDLVDDRNDLMVVVEGQIRVRKGLGFDALGGIDDEQAPLA